jgi:CelD/BcsL family acetyltransferase involved in cellulose biosynthesis
MPQINVTVGFSGADLSPHWEDLAARATPNVFAHPAALDAVAASRFAKLRLLLAWDRGIVPERLVGLWALQEKAVAPLLPAILAAPAYDFAFLSCPVVDPAYAEDVIVAFFDAIRADPGLPNVIRINYLDAEGDSYAAMARALAAVGGEPLTLSQRGRPFAWRESGQKLSGSTRKKLRQDWNRLCAQGTVDIVDAQAPTALRDAFEVFLAMEAKGWKGTHGTSLLSCEQDAAFVRQLLANLGGQKAASVAMLRLDGQPIAAQVLLYCGRRAYTWKTAFDEDYSRYSPGALLVDRLTEQLLARADIDTIDSCSPEGGFMTQLWAGRRTTIDLLVTVEPRRSLSFVLAAMVERGYRQLKRQRASLGATSWATLAGRATSRPPKAAAVTS